MKMTRVFRVTSSNRDFIEWLTGEIIEYISVEDFEFYDVAAEDECPLPEAAE